ncbi:MAG: pentapeptide repeat-containing protein [Actinobacteria bacterium]|nr:pentapeptide repeat-containing protein [Actinomycetota bacterium]
MEDGSAAVELAADCDSCVGICCVALTLTTSADFAIDKPAGQPCENLDDGHRCRIHHRLRPAGFPGCVAFDCFGAGQRVTTAFRNVDPRRPGEDRSAMFAAFTAVRPLLELSWYVRDALARTDLDDQRRRRLRTSATALADRVRQLLAEPSEEWRTDSMVAEVLAILTDVSARLRHARPDAYLSGRQLFGADLRGADLRDLDLSGALLIAADLRGARLDRADLRGADMRNADLRGAMLATALFVTQPQLDAARGDRATSIPASVRRPAHWTSGSSPVRPGKPPRQVELGL